MLRNAWPECCESLEARWRRQTIVANRFAWSAETKHFLTNSTQKRLTPRWKLKQSVSDWSATAQNGCPSKAHPEKQAPWQIYRASRGCPDSRHQLFHVTPVDLQKAIAYCEDCWWAPSNP